MDVKLDKILLIVIQEISAKFGPHAVLKGGMALRLQGIPRSTIDIDYTFKPFKGKSGFSIELIELLNQICEEKVLHQSDSKKIQIKGKLNGINIIVEASALDSDFEPESIDTAILANQYNLQPCVISMVPNTMAFANKLAAWLERRLARDLYDIYVFYDILKVEPDEKILLDRIKKPNYSKFVKPKPELKSIQDFIEFIVSQSENWSDKQIESELAGILETRDLRGIGKQIITTIRRMRF